jgi:hypothetical protein
MGGERESLAKEMNMRQVRMMICAAMLALMCSVAGVAQGATAGAIAELMALREKARHPETRVRVEATHRAWAIGLESADAAVKIAALEVLSEPAGSASDHIRMPAVYAMAEIAGAAKESRVHIRALELLAAPLRAEQVPIRDVAIDAVNIITASSNRAETAPAAVRALAPVVRSGVNGVRIPAINALVRAVAGSGNEAAYSSALDLLVEPLNSMAMIGGMEVRMMAVAAVERIGMEATGTAVKAKAMGLMRSYAGKSGWETEARNRASLAATVIERTLRD